MHRLCILQMPPGNKNMRLAGGIGKEAGTEYWKVVEKGAKQAVSELNSALGYKGEDKIKLNYSGPSESESVDEQINILDE